MSKLSQQTTVIAILFSTLLLSPPVAAQTPGVAECRDTGTPRAFATPGGTSASTPVEREQVDLGDGAGEALVWNSGGSAGAVLVHGAVYDAASWDSQAKEMAAAGLSVIAVEQASAGTVKKAVDVLRNDLNVNTVTLVGASAGGSAVLSPLADEPELADRLVLLSATGDVSKLGDFPKLFVASEGESMADRSQAMAEDAAGAANEALIVPGDAHAQAIFKTEEGDGLVRTLIAFIATGCV